MRKISLLIVFGTIIIVSIIIESCFFCNTKDYKFSWETMDVYNLFVIKEVDNEIESQLSDTTNIEYNKYGILIKFDGEILANTCKKLYFIDECKAQIDCFNAYDPDSKISEIEIITLNDFDDLHPCNSSITQYFEPTLFYGKIVTFDEYLKDKNEINGGTRFEESVFDQEIKIFLNSIAKKAIGSRSFLYQ